jgi:hypothetical protein
MKYFWMTPNDSRAGLYVFRSEKGEEYARLLPQFRMLACNGCGKIDEFAAIRIGIFSSTKSRSKADFQQSEDGLVIVSDRFISVCQEAQISNVEFLPLCPAVDSNLHVMLPLAYAEVDVQQSGYRGLTRCDDCHRWFEYRGFPKVESMTFEREDSGIWHPSVFSELSRGKQFWFLISETTREKLKMAKLKGLGFRAAD